MISVAQYHRLIQTGVLAEHDRIELLAGWIVQRPSRSPMRAVVAGCLRDMIKERLPSGWHLRTQEPITLSDSEPEPDLAIVRGDFDDYASSHPGSTDTLVVIDVMDSTVDEYRSKQAIYSQAGIASYLIINLPESSVEFYSKPGSAGYGDRQVYGADDEVTVAVNQGQVRFRLRDVLPPASAT